jgi:hypothetical protein
MYGNSLMQSSSKLHFRSSVYLRSLLSSLLYVLLHVWCPSRASRKTYNNENFPATRILKWGLQTAPDECWLNYWPLNILCSQIASGIAQFPFMSLTITTRVHNMSSSKRKFFNVDSYFMYTYFFLVSSSYIVNSASEKKWRRIYV